MVFHATLMSMMGDSVFRLSSFLLLSQSRLVAMERVFHLLDQPLEDLEKGDRALRMEGDIAVEFRNVGFSYDSGMADAESRERSGPGTGPAAAGMPEAKTGEADGPGPKGRGAGMADAEARERSGPATGPATAGMPEAKTGEADGPGPKGRGARMPDAEARECRGPAAGPTAAGMPEAGTREADAPGPNGRGSRVIEGLNLILRRGEHLAIVGGSGGGKSTVIKLMEGFYGPTEGEILYFGQKGTGLSLAAIRELFAYVPQECTLFDGTLRENIALGKPDASQAQIEEAAKMADIHGFIVSLPRGYESQAGEQGGQLSGGQRQRIAIARAILKGAPILLLDEATAALDSAAEREVQQCLDRLAHSLTTVTVAHRLSTIRNAHRILVMEGGRIVEEGDFQGLLERRGRFWELYESQRHGGGTGVEEDCSGA